MTTNVRAQTYCIRTQTFTLIKREHTHKHTLALTHIYTLTDAHTLAYTHRRTHTRTHTLTHTLTHRQ